MKNILLSFVGLLPTALLSAQPNTSQIEMASELSSAVSGGKSQFVQTFDNRFQNPVQGSPFLVEDWLPGTLMLFDSSKTGDSLLFKFDTYKNEIWIKKLGGDSIIPFSDYIRQIDLHHPDGRSWHYKKFQVDNSRNPVSFYQPVYEGKQYTLVKDEHKLLVKANFVERGVYTTGLPYDRFEGATVDYYVQTKPFGPFVKINLKKKDFTDLAPKGREKALEDFCKKNKIRQKLSEAEAAQLLSALDGKD